MATAGAVTLAALETAGAAAETAAAPTMAPTGIARIVRAIMTLANRLSSGQRCFLVSTRIDFTPLAPGWYAPPAEFTTARNTPRRYSRLRTE